MCVWERVRVWVCTSVCACVLENVRLYISVCASVSECAGGRVCLGVCVYSHLSGRILEPLCT